MLNFDAILNQGRTPNSMLGSMFGVVKFHNMSFKPRDLQINHVSFVTVTSQSYKIPPGPTVDQVHLHVWTNLQPSSVDVLAENGSFTAATNKAQNCDGF